MTIFEWFLEKEDVVEMRRAAKYYTLYISKDKKKYWWRLFRDNGTLHSSGGPFKTKKECKKSAKEKEEEIENGRAGHSPKYPRKSGRGRVTDLWIK